MTRVFLAAGVAALAIAAPATAGPKEDRQAARAERQQAQPRQQARAERQQAVRAERPQRAERVQMRAERQQVRAERPARVDRQQVRSERPARVERQEARQVRAERPARVERQAAPQQVRETRVQPTREARVQQQQTRQVERQQVRIDRQADRQTMQAQRQELRADRVANRQLTQGVNNGRGYGVGGCPPGLADKGCMPPGIAAKALTADRIANADAFRASRLATLSPLGTSRILAPSQAVRYVGQPYNVVSSALGLAALPAGVSYLYPDTNDYYYRYGDGYLYQVDRTSSLISALLPLLGGGYMPGSYLPSQYMNSYAPSYWGLNSFYPSSYDYGYGYNGYGYNGYGYGSQNLCNRYANGVIYQVDCVTGMIVDVVPTYAGGYGVGQMLPSAYSTYNVPYQYRSMYYDTSDYGYWYAPGAIYQYDPQSSLITSVAALLSPGFSVGQPLPTGYSTYNVPYSYRSTYYDTPNAWYRYNNGYIYQVDPTTQLVSAVVASILT